MSVVAIIQSTRPAFLILAPICVLLGASTAEVENGSVNLSILILAMVGAVLAHISINTLNEVHDFNSGLDFKTKRTAFSGGSGALPSSPKLAGTVFTVGAVSFIATIAVGIYLSSVLGWGIIPIGLIGMLMVAGYSGWITRHPIICLIAPGFGFGFLFVIGTAYVLTGRYSPLPLIVGIVPFCLCNNLLLLNQFPDIAADRAVGRRNFPIIFGTTNSAYIYGLLLLIAIVTIVIGSAIEIFPIMSLTALIPMPLAIIAFRGALKKGTSLGNFPQYLACNVAAAVITPLLFAMSLILG